MGIALMVQPEDGLGGKIHLSSRGIRMGIRRYRPIKQLSEARETYMSLQALK